MIRFENKKNHQIKRQFVIRGITLCMLSVFLLMSIPSATLAHDNKTTHKMLMDYAVNIAVADLGLPIDGSMTARGDEWNRLWEGAEDEDIDPRWLNHFFRPIDNAGMTGGVIAPVKATEYWNSMISAYVNGNLNGGDGNGAWHYLGRISHLLQDMTSPMHVFDKAHPNTCNFESYWPTKQTILEDILKKIEISPIRVLHSDNSLPAEATKHLDELSQSQLQYRYAHNCPDKTLNNVKGYLEVLAWITYFRTTFWGEINFGITGASGSATSARTTPTTYVSDGVQHIIVDQVNALHTMFNTVNDTDDIRWVVDGIENFFQITDKNGHVYVFMDSMLLDDWSACGKDWSNGNIDTSFLFENGTASANYYNSDNPGSRITGRFWFDTNIMGTTSPICYPTNYPDGTAMSTDLYYYFGEYLFPLTVRYNAGLLDLANSRMTDHYTLSGTITDPNNASYIEVYVSDAQGANEPTYVLTSNKTYQMALFPGTYDVTCYSHYASGTWVKSNSQRIAISQNTTLNITVPTYTFYHIRGYVKDSNGNGISGIFVSFNNNNYNCYNNANEIKTDTSGYYDLIVLSGTYSISFSPPDGSPYQDWHIQQNINGNITLSDIVPEQKQTYQVNCSFTNSEGTPTLGMYYYAWVHKYKTDGTDSDYTGKYTSTFPLYLLLGTYNISADLYNTYNKVTGNGYTWTQTTYQSVSEPGTSSLNLPLPTYQYYQVNGIVTDTSGNVQTNVQVHAYDRNYICEGYSTTNSQGRYHLMLIQGEYSIRVTAPAATYPPFLIKNVIILGDVVRNIRLSQEYTILEQAIAFLDPALDIAMDVFDIVNQAEVKNYVITVKNAKQVLQLILQWPGSEMKIDVYDPNGNLYGSYQSTQPPIKIDIPNPAAGDWNFEVTAISVPHDNYAFAMVAGVTKNVAPVAEIGGSYSGSAGSPVTFDGSGSTDTDGNIVLYEWDWDNDGVYDESSTSPSISHTWDSVYSGSIGLRVKDDGGLTSTDTATVNVTQITKYTLNASVSGGHGTVSPTSGSYDKGTVVNLAASPESGYRLKAWSGTDNDSLTTTANTVAMNSNRTVAVEFELIPVIVIPPSLALNASVTGGHGKVSPSSGTYDQGTVVNLTATPDSGYRVKAWNGTNNDTLKTNTNKVTMNSNRNVKVEFELIPVITYNLTASVTNGHGAIEPASGNYNKGTVVNLTATPDSGYRVKAWVGTGNDSSTATENSVIMNADHTVTVEFEPVLASTYILTLTTDGEGTIEVDPSASDMNYEAGTVVTLTAHPKEGWDILKWEGNVDNTGKTITTTVRMDRDQTVKAVFDQISTSEENTGGDSGGSSGCFISTISDSNTAPGILFTIFTGIMLVLGIAGFGRKHTNS